MLAILAFVGGAVVGVVFKDQLIWVKDKVVAFYDWAKAKF